MQLGQGGDDGWCDRETCAPRALDFFHYGPEGSNSKLVGAEMEGGLGVDRLHGGSGNDRLDGGGEVNNILVGGDGASNFCSNGNLDYPGTDRGDIRHITCRWPAPGQSTSVTYEGGGVWSFHPYTIDIDARFDWSTFWTAPGGRRKNTGGSRPSSAGTPPPFP
jgi:hypothetical protein